MGLLMMAWALACAPLSTPAGAPAEAAPPPQVRARAEPAHPLRVEPEALTVGSSEAPVTAVAFLDFECRHCASVLSTLLSLQQEVGADQLRLVYRQAPLPFHRRARAAARAAQAVGQTLGGEVLTRYAQWLFSQGGDLSDENLRTGALSVGMDGARWDALLASQELEVLVDADLERMQELGVEAVPAVFINGHLVLGARPASEFRAAIEHEQRAGQELLRRGVSAREIHALRVEVNRSEEALDELEPAFVVPVGGSPALGPRSAWVTIVEFVDLECPYCARAHGTMEQLMERFPGRLRWVVKHQPLGFHEHAVPAAIVVSELYEQQGVERSWQAMEELYAAAPLTMDKLRALAARFGLDTEALNAALSLGLEHPRLLADYDLAEDLHTRGIPQFFINGRRLEGARPLQHFVARVEAELKRVEQAIGKHADPNTDVYALLQAQARPPPGLPRVTPPPVGEQSPVFGPEQAPVTIQMFADFECGYCARVMPTLRKLLERHDPEVRLVWRHLPLSFHANARLAAQAAMEARAQQGDAGFWAMASLFFEEQQLAADAQSAESVWSTANESVWSTDHLRERARGLGLDVARFDAALADGRHLEAIEQDVRLAAELELQGTPAFFVNERLLMGAQPERRFERAVRLARRDAEETN